MENTVNMMKMAIEVGDIAPIGRLAEEDSLNLHVSTMTGETRMLLWELETVHIIRAVQKMRHEGIPAWYSIDTGPSVLLNTYTNKVESIVDRLHGLGVSHVITSRVGGKTFLTNKHLF